MTENIKELKRKKNKINKEMKKLKIDIKKRKKFADFDLKYTKEGVFSNSYCKLDADKVRLCELTEEHNKIRKQIEFTKK